MPSVSLPRLSGVSAGEIKAAMARIADRLIEGGVPPRVALGLAYESVMRLARRQERASLGGEG